MIFAFLVAALVINGDLPKGEITQPVIIKYCPGGKGEYAMSLSRVPMIVDGPCNSACALAFIRNRRSCFTKNASFIFHAPRDPVSGERMPAADVWWISETEYQYQRFLASVLTDGQVSKSAARLMREIPGKACSFSDMRWWK